MNCPRCAATIAPQSRYCASCGLSLEETLLGGDAGGAPHTGPSRASDAAWLSSSSSLDSGFAAGTLLLGRYRIVGLLGRGGMGEVYRADDLTLGQAVALKFLPRDLAASPERLARFHAEVRIARGVSHPNVCRVYDIGDLGGQPFLSMEFVDGEDLSSLLQRIGRLPQDKAIDISRQICAGLAAAHQTGVLHRDLKPGNVMLDRRGKVRLTDFGLAVLQQDGPRAEHAGTPAYMAPEQLARGEVSAQSDIYALGLVLYEMLTGKRPHRAETLAELGAERSRLPPGPASVVEAVDPVLERAILRCLEPEPALRPKSVLSVAASLPGANPLTAALEAGETPSPDMVAAAGEEGRLRPLAGFGLCGGVLVALAVLLGISPRYYLVNQVPLPKRPAVLEDRAMEIVAALGYEDAPGDHASGFTYDRSYLDWVTREDKNLERWRALEHGPAAVLFWYRQAPEHLRALRFGRMRPDYGDPPPLEPGMVRVLLDGAGRLQHFDAVPAEIDSAPAAGVRPAETLSPQWLQSGAELFELAGLDASQFTAVTPAWVPPHYCDSRSAWLGTYPATSIPLRIEAGWQAGKLVHFALVGPWRQPRGLETSKSSRLGSVTPIVATVLVFGLLVGSVLAAYQNLRNHRGDRRGATRLAGFIFLLFLLVWVFQANHAASVPVEFDQLTDGIAVWLFVAALFWVIYIAIEPYLRRKWPDLIISWTRLLGGRLRDPLVCRHVLIGALAGATFTLLDSLDHFLPAWLGIPPRYPETGDTQSLHGPIQGAVMILEVLANSMFAPLAIVCILLGLRQLLRNQWVAAAVVVVAIGLIVGNGNDPGGAHPQVSVPLGFVLIAGWMFLVLRYGVLALVVSAFVSSLLELVIITTDLSRWYAASGVVALVAVVGLAVYAAWNTQASRPRYRLE